MLALTNINNLKFISIGNFEDLLYKHSFIAFVTSFIIYLANGKTLLAGIVFILVGFNVEPAFFSEVF